jgi:predicted mannosyl-3-phosphoglycerate phosphatase (HAD superfamily)
MRTTINLDDDIYYTTKHIASHENKTAGEVLSQLARLGLQIQATSSSAINETTKFDRELADLGLIPYAAQNGKIVTNQLVNDMRDEEGI